MDQEIEGLAAKLNKRDHYSIRKNPVSPSSVDSNDFSQHINAFPQELIDFSAKIELIKALEQSPQNLGKLKERSFDFTDYAAPLISLNQRDLKALSDLFIRKDMEEIEINIKDILLIFYPAPYWEDETFEFLIEYL